MYPTMLSTKATTEKQRGTPLSHTHDHTFDTRSNVDDDPSRPTLLLYPTGVYFEPFNPNPEHLDIRCIAHGLAGTNRYNGHTKSLVNTADHSVIVSLRAEVLRGPLSAHELLAKDAREGRAVVGDLRDAGVTAFGYGTALRRLKLPFSALMHDAPEAVSGFGDVTGPVKNHPSFKALLVAHEDRIADAVAVKHNLPKNFQHDPVVKEADAWAFHWENRDLRGIDSPEGVVLPKEKLQPLSHHQARNAFLFRYMDLTGEAVEWPEDWTPGGFDNHLASWCSYLTTMCAVV
jgi:hypothetical protein